MRDEIGGSRLYTHKAFEFGHAVQAAGVFAGDHWVGKRITTDELCEMLLGERLPPRGHLRRAKVIAKMNRVVQQINVEARNLTKEDDGLSPYEIVYSRWSKPACWLVLTAKLAAAVRNAPARALSFFHAQYRWLKAQTEAIPYPEEPSGTYPKTVAIREAMIQSLSFLELGANNALEKFREMLQLDPEETQALMLLLDGKSQWNELPKSRRSVGFSTR